MNKKIGFFVVLTLLLLACGALAAKYFAQDTNKNSEIKKSVLKTEIPETEVALSGKDAVPQESYPDENIPIIKIDDNNFEREILNSDKDIILEFSSTSCPPCLIMIPTLISVAKNYEGIKIGSVGIDEPNIEKIKNTFPIQAFPTFVFIKNGKIIATRVGVIKEEDLLKPFNRTTADKIKTKETEFSGNEKRHLSCSVNGQFNGLKNFVTISFDFVGNKIENADIVTDVFIPPELESKKPMMLERFIASGKGEVFSTPTGFRMHTANDSRFMKAMDMKRTSTYGEMKAGLELQGFTCK